MTILLGIETSCDECAASVYDTDRGILSNIINSQVNLHARYGGIVPELAGRRHLETIVPVVSESLERAGININNLDGIAVTMGPGLLGSLLCGVSFAKSMSLALNIPLIGVDHLKAHVAAAFVPPSSFSPPCVALLVSGGHTSLYYVEAPGRQKLLGKTRDDAAGEAFDKVSKALGLGYPGGAVVEKTARTGKKDAVKLPLPFPGTDSLDFSFSGIKTAVVQLLASKGFKPGDKNIPPDLKADICLAFQDAVVKVLTKKTIAAAERTGAKKVTVCGGVAANSALKNALKSECSKRNLEFHAPPLDLCTDNAAMIAFLGAVMLERKEICGLKFPPYPRSPENT